MPNCGYYCVMFALYSGPNGSGEFLGYTQSAISFREIAPESLQFEANGTGSRQVLVLGGPYATMGAAVSACGSRGRLGRCLPEEQESEYSSGQSIIFESSPASSSFSYSMSYSESYSESCECTGPCDECGIEFFCPQYFASGGPNYGSEYVLIKYRNTSPNLTFLSDIVADVGGGRGYTTWVTDNPIAGCSCGTLGFEPQQPMFDPVSGRTVTLDWDCGGGETGQAAHTL